MHDKRLLWLFIQQSLGCGSHKVKDLLEKFETSESFFKSGYKDWRDCKIFSKKELYKLSNFNFNLAENLLKYCESKDYKILTIEDESYPFRLKNIYNPPALLFVKGNLPEIDNIVTISIVGTRNATDYGKRIAYSFANKLAELGVIIVSGGAIGIDSIAQRGALKASGKVISVLGCGLDSNYLMVNSKLRDYISKNGALITEYLPNVSPLPRNFPLRNRIMSGLSLGTLVVEADLNSGALITAKWALEQNRDVFAVPGNIASRKSMGSNNLIKNGAKLVTCVDDLLEDYYDFCPKFNIIKKANKKIDFKNIKKGGEKLKAQKCLNDNISKNAKILYDNLEEKPLHMDVLISKTGISVQNFLQAVTELELYNLIKVEPGRNYSKM